MELVLITGASSGVGEAAARKFVKRGAKVILVARSADKLEAVAADIGFGAVAAPCDAADPAAVAALAEQVLETHGVPDVIVNCAGAGAWKSVQDTSPKEAVTMMNAPYFAAFNITHVFLPAMIARGSGQIMHINSPACLAAWRRSAGYAAARAALLGFHRALSQDLVGTGVESCHVIFGRVDTSFFAENNVQESDIPWLDKLVPRLSVEDCADALADLAIRPRAYAIYPFLLVPHIAVAMVAPRFAAWMLRF
ncbi:MAG: SDR family NAD(P)-dependent oxidoreductase [Roseobacter sp.]